MNDIVGTMFNKAFLEELLRPQDLYSHRALRTVLTRIAHTSIMRLNPASMDKVWTHPLPTQKQINVLAELKILICHDLSYKCIKLKKVDKMHYFGFTYYPEHCTSEY